MSYTYWLLSSVLTHPLPVVFWMIVFFDDSERGVNMDLAMSAHDPLNRELRLYSEKKRSWLVAHANQFVVICEDRVEGFHDDFESAFKAGLKAFGLGRQFLVKQVCETEPVYVVY